MPEEPFTRRSQVAVDWDIKQTPRFLYYILIDSKADFLKDRRLRKAIHPKLFAKYTGDLYMLYYSVQAYFDSFLNSSDDMNNPLELTSKDYEQLEYEEVELQKVSKLDKVLVRWLFTDGPFKTDSEEKFFDDIAEQIDYERGQF